MKYIISLILVILFASLSTAQEAHFGIKGGANFTFYKTDELNFGTHPDSDTGFYAGLFIDFEVNETFSLQPEVLYIGINDFSFLNIPLYAKYEVANNLYILAGPSMNYFFNFLINKFKVRADLSTAYNITQNLDIHIKYTLGFEQMTPNGIFVGLGLKL